MAKIGIKRGDEVVVIAGDEKGKRGTVIQVMARKQRVIVEGIKMIKKHIKKNQQNPEGAISEREGTVHLSNVMPAAKYDARKAKRNGESA